MNRSAKTLVTNLEWLIKAQEISETIATPNILFDVDAVRKYSGESDPLVFMRRIFIQYANTGCRSPLEKFRCNLLTADGDQIGPEFVVDLIEGLSDLVSQESPWPHPGAAESLVPDDADSLNDAG